MPWSTVISVTPDRSPTYAMPFASADTNTVYFAGVPHFARNLRSFDTRTSRTSPRLSSVSVGYEPNTSTTSRRGSGLVASGDVTSVTARKPDTVYAPPVPSVTPSPVTTSVPAFPTSCSLFFTLSHRTVNTGAVATNCATYEREST